MSQHCPRDWSLPWAPRPWEEPGGSGSSLFFSQPEKRLYAGRGWGLEVPGSELGKPEELELLVPLPPQDP